MTTNKQYFALSENLQDLKDIRVILGDGKVYTIQVNEDNNVDMIPMKNNIATNSHFYGLIMQDANIFNPYLHRRFLPPRFIWYVKKSVQIENLERSEQSLVPKFVASIAPNMTAGYAFKCFLNELKTLVVLSNTKNQAFDERSVCLPIELADYFLDYFITCNSVSIPKPPTLSTYHAILYYAKQIRLSRRQKKQPVSWTFAHWFVDNGIYWTLRALSSYPTFTRQDTATKLICAEILGCNADYGITAELYKRMKEAGLSHEKLILSDDEILKMCKLIKELL